jgi:hypothetical protein
MRQTELSLSKRERESVQAFRSEGAHMAREFHRAHILPALDRKIPERRGSWKCSTCAVPRSGGPEPHTWVKVRSVLVFSVTRPGPTIVSE